MVAMTAVAAVPALGYPSSVTGYFPVAASDGTQCNVNMSATASSYDLGLLGTVESHESVDCSGPASFRSGGAFSKVVDPRLDNPGFGVQLVTGSQPLSLLNGSHQGFGGDCVASGSCESWDQRSNLPKGDYYARQTLSLTFPSGGFYSWTSYPTPQCGAAGLGAQLVCEVHQWVSTP